MQDLEIKKKLKKKFQELFGDSEDVRFFFAPGRVNLIGEHTDYNGGHVFPCALSMGTYACVKKRQDGIFRFYSLNVESAGVITADKNSFKPLEDKQWASYLKGVIWAFQKRGFVFSEGLDLVLYGNIPNGSGLSSSASLEVLMGSILKEIYGLSVSLPEIALIGQYSENNYNGMNCGIMDQFASAMGKKDHAIFLDTANLEFSYAPLVLTDYALIITNTNKKHKLIGSAYNDRRRESEEALEILQKFTDIKTLGDLSDEEFFRLEEKITNPIIRKRAKHAVLENNRTIAGKKALEKGDYVEFGRLMNLSHLSLRDDYEVSCEESDLLCETAWSLPYVLGSRMTGGGFGGCTVSLVKRDKMKDFEEELQKVYEPKIGYPCSFYEAEIADGPREL
mgnify:FL=1